LITASENEKEGFVNRQKAKGFDVNTIADVLSLNKDASYGRPLFIKIYPTNHHYRRTP
jgi:hypothetical protein